MFPRGKVKESMNVRVKEKFIPTGQYAEVEYYPCIHRPRARREKFQPTTAAQEVINQRHAERRLRRLIHANFTGDDFSVCLEYSNLYRPDDVRAVKRDVKNFLRRLRRRYEKNGVELKYIYAVEEAQNKHIHIILNSNPAGGDLDRQRRELEMMWGFGYANVDRLQLTEYGVADLAAYIQKQHFEYRRYTCSKNLIKPEENAKKRPVSKKLRDELFENWNCQSFVEKQYPDYFLVLDESECVRNTSNGFDYIRLFLCRKDAKLSFYSTSLAEYDERIAPALKRRAKASENSEFYSSIQDSLF